MSAWIKLCKEYLLSSSYLLARVGGYRFSGGKALGYADMGRREKRQATETMAFHNLYLGKSYCSARRILASSGREVI